MYEGKSENKRLNRRSFIARVMGASMFGSVAIPTRANAQNATGRTDSDSGASADRAGYGRTGVTDSDGGAGADRAGYGRGGAGTSSTGLTDSDQGAGADRAGYGRGGGGRGATGITDSDQGAYADPAGNERGVIRREQTPDLPVGQRVTAQDVQTVRRALASLAAGDPTVALAALDPRVRWQAAASRAFTDAITLDRRGADLYVRQMARSIASGERRLEIISIAAAGDHVVVESEWVKPGERASPPCITVFTVVASVVLVVNEVVNIPPDIAR